MWRFAQRAGATCIPSWTAALSHISRYVFTARKRRFSIFLLPCVVAGPHQVWSGLWCRGGPRVSRIRWPDLWKGGPPCPVRTMAAWHPQHPCALLAPGYDWVETYAIHHGCFPCAGFGWWMLLHRTSTIPGVGPTFGSFKYLGHSSYEAT